MSVMPAKPVHSSVSVKQLLNLIPDEELSRLAGETGVDYWASVLYGRSMFYLLLYGLADGEKTSLRSLEDIFNSRRFKYLFNLDPDQTTRYNSISSRLATMDVSFFEEAYKLIFAVFRDHFSETEALGYNIVRVDSTMVAETASKLEKGMHVGSKNNKNQIKYTVCLEDLLPSSVQIFTEQKHLNEDLTIPSTILKMIDPRPDTVFVFDRGVKSRKAYEDITKKEWMFVTRVKEDTRYEVVEELNTVKGSQIGNLFIESDTWVYLYDGKSKKTNIPFRLIKTKNEQGKSFLFLSNMKNATAEEIIMIYKKRWDIEVFFRFIKQELNFSHFISTNINGIKIIVYMTLILSMLIHIYKKYNQVGFKTAKRRVKIELDDLLTALIVQASGGDPNIFFRGP
jgi:Transposase DDE domain